MATTKLHTDLIAMLEPAAYVAMCKTAAAESQSRNVTLHVMCEMTADGLLSYIGTDDQMLRLIVNGRCPIKVATFNAA